HEDHRVAIPQTILLSKHYGHRWLPRSPRFHPALSRRSSRKYSRCCLCFLSILAGNDEPSDNNGSSYYEEIEQNHRNYLSTTKRHRSVLHYSLIHRFFQTAKQLVQQPAYRLLDLLTQLL